MVGIDENPAGQPDIPQALAQAVPAIPAAPQQMQDIPQQLPHVRVRRTHKDDVSLGTIGPIRSHQRLGRKSDSEKRFLNVNLRSPSEHASPASPHPGAVTL